MADDFTRPLSEKEIEFFKNQIDEWLLEIILTIIFHYNNQLEDLSYLLECISQPYMQYIYDLITSGRKQIKMKAFNFRGLMAPVFTPFQNNENKTLNLDIIPTYAKYILGCGINGVLVLNRDILKYAQSNQYKMAQDSQKYLTDCINAITKYVNGTSGEGSLMTVGERKLVTEKWVEACKTTKQTLMVQIGGASMPDVIELAKHAEENNVDAMLCLPELYFKPKCTSDLVDYLSVVSQSAPNTPLLYYHIPMFSDVNLNMPEFLNEAYDKINTLVGIKFTSCDLNEGIQCVNVRDRQYRIFLGADQIMVGAYSMGFDSAIATTLNIFPELNRDILKYVQSHQYKMAQDSQKCLTDRINAITKYGSWVTSMKGAMNIIAPFNVGPTRFPLKNLSSKELENLEKDLK